MRAYCTHWHSYPKLLLQSLVKFSPTPHVRPHLHLIPIHRAFWYCQWQNPSYSFEMEFCSSETSSNLIRALSHHKLPIGTEKVKKGQGDTSKRWGQEQDGNSGHRGQETQYSQFRNEWVRTQTRRNVVGKGHEREQGASLDSTVNQIWPGSLRKTWQKVCYRWAMGIRSSLWPLVSVRSVGKILFSHTGQVTQKSLYPLDISIFITQTGRKKQHLTN